jgi:hypothetical protein
MFSRAAGRRALVAMAAVVAASLAVGVGGASAGRVDPPGHQDANHCSWFFSGVDLNALYGVPEQFHHFLSCTEDLSAGEHWRPFVSWIVDDGVDSVYPTGYVPLRPLPVDDFVAKLTVRVVTDGGTSKQKTYVFSSAAAVRTDITLDQLEPDAPPLGLAVTMPRMKPLSVGAHTYEVTWVLSAQHCDGFGTVVQESCLPAGELPIDGGPLTVTTPAH